MTREPITVSQLNEYVKAKIDGDPLLSNVTVRGEISNFTNHYKSGHFYLSLKDEGAVIQAVMFRANAQKLQFLPENGMKVICRGRVSAYVKSGQYQIYIEEMQPDGVGALYLAFEQLKRKLEAEGLFDPAHKKPIPKIPLTVGIITSPTGAAVRDMINVSGRRFPLARLVLFPCLVQGAGAPAQLCRGIRFFNESLPVDVIIIGRGGGSLEELWAFNDEALARAIHASRIPVISAVGHETDFSISDFAADLRAPTPSAAAELALPEIGELRRKFTGLTDRMALSCEHRIRQARTRVEALAASKNLKSMSNLIDDRRLALASLERDADRAMRRILEQKAARLSQRAAKLDALSPLAVMARGYSAVFDGSGKALSSRKGLKAGDPLRVRFSDGAVNTIVKGWEDHDRENGND